MRSHFSDFGIWNPRLSTSTTHSNASFSIISSSIIFSLHSLLCQVLPWMALSSGTALPRWLRRAADEICRSRFFVDQFSCKWWCTKFLFYYFAFLVRRWDKVSFLSLRYYFTQLQLPMAISFQQFGSWIAPCRPYSSFWDNIFQIDQSHGSLDVNMKIFDWKKREAFNHTKFLKVLIFPCRFEELTFIFVIRRLCALGNYSVSDPRLSRKIQAFRSR